MRRFVPLAVLGLSVMAGCSSDRGDTVSDGSSRPSFCERKLAAASAQPRYEPATTTSSYKLGGFGHVAFSYIETGICLAAR